ncbi:hypothetical protein STRCR_0208 [Streptococcus criceti HS-6]|uniref:Uncharacterized protein n=1 Tax=Streptococcus criceti HS-6 TaxID=873449 RepID=G5JNQ1_STRCG|nr:hypothetical protein STRCR_0208 [Streptococcus criceti HS-6]
MQTVRITKLLALAKSFFLLWSLGFVHQVPLSAVELILIPVSQ